MSFPINVINKLLENNLNYRSPETHLDKLFVQFKTYLFVDCAPPIIIGNSPVRSLICSTLPVIMSRTNGTTSCFRQLEAVSQKQRSYTVNDGESTKDDYFLFTEKTAAYVFRILL